VRPLGSLVFIEAARVFDSTLGAGSTAFDARLIVVKQQATFQSPPSSMASCRSQKRSLSKQRLVSLKT